MYNNSIMKYSMLLLFLFHSQITFSQELEFRSNTRLVLGNGNEKSASIDVGDIDKDGDLDILVANGRHWPEPNMVFFNNGFGIFTVSKLLDNISETSYATELADFDGDGDLDVAVGNDMAPNAIYINDGKGNFSRARNFGNNYSPTRNLKTTDIDMDGDIDILITNRGKENEICLNNGKGDFSEIIKFGSKDDSTIDVEVIDIDKDGDKDLVLANRDQQQNLIYLNNGQLKFTEKSHLEQEPTKQEQLV